LSVVTPVTTGSIGQNNNVADQHPDILQKMIAAYEKYAQDVGVVIPRGAAFAKSVAGLLPPINVQDKVTIQLNDMIPGYNGTEHKQGANPPGV